MVSFDQVCVESVYTAIVFGSSTHGKYTFTYILSSTHAFSFDRVHLESVYNAILLGSSTHIQKRIAVLFITLALVRVKNRLDVLVSVKL